MVDVDIEGLEDEQLEPVLPPTEGANEDAAQLSKALAGFQFWHVDGGHALFQAALGSLCDVWCVHGSQNYDRILNLLDDKWELKYGQGPVPLPALRIQGQVSGDTPLLDLVRWSVRRHSKFFTPDLLKCCEEELPIHLQNLRLSDIPAFMRDLQVILNDDDIDEFDIISSWKVEPRPRSQLAYFFFTQVLIPLADRYVRQSTLYEATTTLVSIVASTKALEQNRKERKLSFSKNPDKSSNKKSYPFPRFLLPDKKPEVTSFTPEELRSHLPQSCRLVAELVSNPSFQNVNLIKASLVLEWVGVPKRCADSLALALEDTDTGKAVARAVMELYRKKICENLLPLSESCALDVFASTTQPAKSFNELQITGIMPQPKAGTVLVSLADLGGPIDHNVVLQHCNVLFQSINHLQHPWGWDLMHYFYVLFSLVGSSLDFDKMNCGSGNRYFLNDDELERLEKFLAPFGFQQLGDNCFQRNPPCQKNTYLLLVSWNQDLHTRMVEHARHYLERRFTDVKVYTLQK